MDEVTEVDTFFPCISWEKGYLGCLRNFGTHCTYIHFQGAGRPRVRGQGDRDSAEGRLPRRGQDTREVPQDSEMDESAITQNQIMIPPWNWINNFLQTWFESLSKKRPNTEFWFESDSRFAHSLPSRILFDTRDVSRVKQFAQRQFAKILSGRASLQDLTFAKEFRGVEGGRIRVSH